MTSAALARPRTCLRQPIPEIERAAERLDHAAAAHVRGDKYVAEELLRLANDGVVWTWLDEVWGKTSPYNQRLRSLGMAPLPKTLRCRPRDATTTTKRLIHERDGYYCRFCKIPVIRSEVRRYFQFHYPETVSWGSTNETQHAAFQCMWAQYDHILPHAMGGSSGIENVYLTCAACNYGRGNYLLEECDLIHPSDHPPRVGPWDGLERVLRLGAAHPA